MYSFVSIIVTIVSPGPFCWCDWQTLHVRTRTLCKIYQCEYRCLSNLYLIATAKAIYRYHCLTEHKLLQSHPVLFAIDGFIHDYAIESVSRYLVDRPDIDVYFARDLYIVWDWRQEWGVERLTRNPFIPLALRQLLKMATYSEEDMLRGLQACNYSASESSSLMLSRCRSHVRRHWHKLSFDITFFSGSACFHILWHCSHSRGWGIVYSFPNFRRFVLIHSSSPGRFGSTFSLPT